MEFKQSGILIFKDEEKQISETFKTREFVIEVINEQNTAYNNFIKFQLSNDKCSLIDNIAIGAPIEVSFNLHGRKWEKDGKISYFNSLNAWRITAQSQIAGSATPVTFSANMPVVKPIFTPPTNEQGNDLPF